MNQAGGEPVEVGDLLSEALEVALRAARATDGAVDPTVGRAIRDLGYDRDFERPRPATRAAGPRCARAPGWRSVRLDGAPARVRVPAGVELDLGATAKALAADRIAAARRRR